MKIRGFYEKDDNFTYVFTKDTLFTIANATGEWGSVSIGDRTFSGKTLTKERFDEWKGECEKEGTFEL